MLCHGRPVVLLRTALLVSACAAVSAADSCIENAKLAIAKTPEKLTDEVTTSKTFKLHMAEYFCRLGSPKMTVLELGVHKGYTTLVWASIFQKVIAVDINESFLRTAGKTTAEKTNVVFLSANLMADSWTIFRSNQVDVVIVDANHDFHFVRADAYNSLRHLPSVKYMAFHDYGAERGVRRTVNELTGRRILRDCQKLGVGWDGTPWEYNEWNRAMDTLVPTMTNYTEGVACRIVRPQKLHPPFTDLRFYVYKQPIREMRHEGVLRFLPAGTVNTDVWGVGSWIHQKPALRDTLLISLPRMSKVPIELLFNEHRTAFLLTDIGEVDATWYGLQENLAIRELMRTSGEF